MTPTGRYKLDNREKPKNYGQKRGGRHHSGGRYRNVEETGEGSTETYRRPPKYLKGKDIGLYYKMKLEERMHNIEQKQSQGMEPGSTVDSNKRPPNLKGKEIGLFYARKGRERRLLEDTKPLATILLSEKKKQEIQEILAETHLTSNFSNNKSNKAYDHVEDSSFKRQFLSIINGNINENLCNPFAEIVPNPNLDLKLYEEQIKTKESNLRYKNMLQVRKKLPSYKMREELINLINNNQVIVISGETGCGKTTQVAQFILDDYIKQKKGSMCNVVCTQPRRISAISVAERVAQERGENLGISTGYQIRLEKKLPRSKGSICFCTTGVVLKQMETDPALSSISHLILDEIHERDVMCDFLLCLLKKVITKRKDLTVILMSATLNSEAFSKYFDNCPHINIPGFTYPVEEYFLEDALQRTGFTYDNDRRFGGRNSQRANREYTEFMGPHIRRLEAEKKYSKQVCMQLWNPQCEEINFDLTLALLDDICYKEKDNGSVLIFLPGYTDISKLAQMIEQSTKFPSNKYIIIPLHSQMPTVDQRKIFEPSPQGMRKIIISTNIAETSITIDDVVYVIDCGKIKMSNFDVETNTQTLLPEWVSVANANQRRGRAGRVQPGVCYHLMTKARYMDLEKYQKPEILRKRLDDVILTTKMLQLGKVEPFFECLLDSPDPKAVKLSLNLLNQMNALDDNENLTPLGYHLAKLPICPQMGKMILFGAMFSCLDPILSVATSLDFKDAFQMPLGMEKHAEAKKMELSDGGDSDHLLFHKALMAFEEAHNPRQFCWQFFLSSHTLKLLQDMKRQFMRYLSEMNFVTALDPKSEECNVNSDNESLVKAIVCSGLYPNVAIVRARKKNTLLYSLTGEKLNLHPKSILAKERFFESPLLVYFLKIKSTSNFIHDASIIHPLPVIFFGDNFENLTNNGHNLISIGRKLKFKMTVSTSSIIRELRNSMNALLEHKISHPGVVDWTVLDTCETKILRAIMELITSEDLGDIDSDAFDDCDD